MQTSKLVRETPSAGPTKVDACCLDRIFWFHTCQTNDHTFRLNDFTEASF